MGSTSRQKISLTHHAAYLLVHGYNCTVERLVRGYASVGDDAAFREQVPQHLDVGRICVFVQREQKVQTVIGLQAVIASRDHTLAVAVRRR